MKSLDARRICGCRVEERVHEDSRTLVSLEPAVDDASRLTVSCAGHGLSLHAEPLARNLPGELAALVDPPRLV